MWIKLNNRKQEEVDGEGAASDGGAPEASASSDVPAGVVDGSATLGAEDISAMLSFDPFEDLPDDPASPKDPAQVEGASAADDSPEAGVVDPAKPVETPAQPVAPEKSPEVLALEAQLMQMQQTMQQMQQAVAQAPQAPAQQGGDPYAQFIPSYEFQIPQEMAALLDSEDPTERATGIQQLLGASMRTTHRNVLEQVNGMLSSYVPQQLQQYEQQTTLKSQVTKDFYGTYPDLDTPEIRQLVGMVTPRVAQQLGSSAWNPMLRDTIAANVRQMLSQRPTQQMQQPAPQPTQFDSSARPAVPGGSNVTREIMSLM